MPEPVKLKNIARSMNGIDDTAGLIELKKVNHQLREARRAALNLMEDAIQTKEALQKSEEKYRSLFNSIDEGFSLLEMISDDAGNIVDYWHRDDNPAFKRMTGIKDSDNKRMRELVPDLEPEWYKLLEKVYRTGEPTRAEYPVEALGQWYSCYLSRVGEKGSPFIAAVYDDITERKRHEANLAFLAEVSEYLVHLTNIDETINTLGGKICAHFHASQCAFGEVDKEQQIITITNEWKTADAGSFKGAHRIAEYEALEYLEASRAGKTYVVRDTATDPRLNGQIQAPGIGAFVSMPLVRNGKWCFVMTLYDSGPRDWHDDEMELLHEIVSRIWTRLERARAEEALRQKEAELDAIITQTPFMLSRCTRDLRYRYVSRAYAAMVNRTPEEINGRPITEIMSEEGLKTIMPYVERVLNGERVEYEDEVDFRNGNERSLHVVYTPDTDNSGNINGWFASIVDITDRKNAEEALRASEARLRVTLESAVDFAIINIDTEGMVEGWSTGAESIFEYKAEEITGTPVAVIFTDEDRAEGVPEKEMAAAREKGRAADERWHQRKDGSRFYVSGIMRPVYNPELTGYVKIARDMTLQKVLEQQKDEFIGIASHELKTPVTSIKAYTELLRDMLDEAGNHEDVKLVEKLDLQVDRLAELIRALLDTTRIGEGQLLLNADAFDLNELIRERIEELQHTTGNHRLIFNSSGAINITADRERIGQVLINLISNGIKYAPKGGEIKIVSERTENNVQVSVRDHGLGIAADVKDKIFDKFYRVRNAQIDTFPGMGLGLYITAAIVRRHKGKIWVESKLNEGSIFYFSLPIKKDLSIPAL